MPADLIFDIVFDVLILSAQLVTIWLLTHPKKQTRDAKGRFSR